MMDNALDDPKKRKRENSSPLESLKSNDAHHTQNDEQESAFRTVIRLPSVPDPAAKLNSNYDEGLSDMPENAVIPPDPKSSAGESELQNRPVSTQVSDIQPNISSNLHSSRNGGAAKRGKSSMSRSTQLRREAEQGELRAVACARCSGYLLRDKPVVLECRKAITARGTKGSCHKCYRDGQSCLDCPDEMLPKFKELIEAIEVDDEALIEKVQSDVKGSEIAQSGIFGYKRKKRQYRAKNSSSKSAKDPISKSSIITRAMANPHSQKVKYVPEASDLEDPTDDDADEDVSEDDYDEDAVGDDLEEEEWETDDENGSQASQDTQTLLENNLTKIKRIMTDSTEQLIARALRKARKITAKSGETISDNSLHRIRGIMLITHEEATEKNMVVMKDYMRYYLEKYANAMAKGLSEDDLRAFVKKMIT